MPIDWVPLSLGHGPTFASQVDELINAYVASYREGSLKVVKYLQNAIAECLPRLEDFCLENDQDERILLFQKQVRRFRKLLHSKPEDFSNEGTTIDTPQGLDDSEDDATGSPEKGPGLAMGSLSATNDHALLASTLSKSSRLAESSRVSSGEKKPKRLLYAWETKVDTGNESSRNLSLLLRDDDVFTFQVVMSASDYHHFEARRTIKRKETAFKEKALLKQAEDEFSGDDIRRRNGRRHGGITGYRRMMHQGPYIDPTYANNRIFRSPNKNRWMEPKGFSTAL